MQQNTSPVRAQYPGQFDTYSRSPGKQPYSTYVADRGGMTSTENVVKKPKLSAYTQNIQWDEDSEEDDDDAKIDPTSFFSK